MRNERSVDGADEVVLVGVWPQDRDRAMQVFGEMQAPLRDDPECNREGRTTSREAPDVVDPGFAFLTVDESHDSPAASTEDAQGDPERRSHLRAYTWVSAHDTADPAARLDGDGVAVAR